MSPEAGRQTPPPAPVRRPDAPPRISRTQTASARCVACYFPATASALRSLPSPPRPSVLSTVTATFASLTTLDRLAQVPASTWMVIGLVIGGVLFGVPLVRKIMEISGIWILLALVCGSVLVSAHWVYHRSEPALLTPLVDFVAPFFPKKVAPKK